MMQFIFNPFYVVAVIIITYLLLTYILKNPNRFWKIAVNVLVGLLLATVWIWIYGKVVIEQIIVSFLLSVVFYTWIVKSIIQYFKPRKDVYERKNKGSYR